VCERERERESSLMAVPGKAKQMYLRAAVDEQQRVVLGVVIDDPAATKVLGRGSK
jgi:hypothetical protein